VCHILLNRKGRIYDSKKLRKSGFVRGRNESARVRVQDQKSPEKVNSSKRQEGNLGGGKIHTRDFKSGFCERDWGNLACKRKKKKKKKKTKLKRIKGTYQGRKKG